MKKKGEKQKMVNMDKSKFLNGEPGIITCETDKSMTFFEGASQKQSSIPKKWEEMRSLPIILRNILYIIRKTSVLKSSLNGENIKEVEYFIFDSPNRALQYWNEVYKKFDITQMPNNCSILFTFYHGVLSEKSYDIIPLSADLPSFCRKSTIEVIDWKEFISSDGISEVRCAPWITVKIDDVLNKGN